MSDPFLTLGRVFMLVLIPIMLLFPLAFAAIVPSRAVDDSARIRARGLLLVLAVSTAVLLALWLGLVLTGVRSPRAALIAGFWWPWFFPLWFLLAMPAIVAKNPGWGWAVGGPATSSVRTASLVNRERKNPVTRLMWLVPIAVVLLVLSAIAARGLVPFGASPVPGSSTLAPDATRGVYAQSERTRWLMTLVVCGGVFGLLLAILPRSIRRTLSEPEPMSAAGSAELADLYQRQRRKRVLGLFWGIGTVLPLCIGSFTTLQVWFPSAGSAWGLAGSIGGSLLGITGAIFGTWMTVERVKIAEIKSRLDQASSMPG